ncbi:LMP1 [Symbiodinium natans]|uniref:LMP1 protein n=1 Tax=Symbiodinium natans TaxID=878477 RepID=A0A812KZK4_9DINO|nr:LMP1 [Symbiodinium natans]
MAPGRKQRRAERLQSWNEGRWYVQQSWKRSGREDWRSNGTSSSSQWEYSSSNGNRSMDYSSSNGSRSMDYSSSNGSRSMDYSSSNGSRSMDYSSSNGSRSMDYSSSNGSRPLDYSSSNGSRSLDHSSSNGSRPVEYSSSNGVSSFSTSTLESQLAREFETHKTLLLSQGPGDKNAGSDYDLISTLVKRAFVWKRHDLVKEAAEGDVEEVAAAVADAYALPALTKAAAQEELFRALVIAQSENLRTPSESNDDVAIAAVFDDIEDEEKEVDLETLDLGLFTASPGPALLFHQCVPVIWVTLINMWPELLSKYLQMIWCKPVSEQGGVVVQRLQPHPDVECWTGDHVPIAMIATVGLSVWCIGIPLLLYLAIWRLKDRNTQENYRTYGYFIDGFEPAYWWWDILVKRADVAIMMLVTYTSVADDEKAKLLIYPFISGGQLALTAWCRPFLNNQAEVLDFLEYILSSFRFLFFSGIALLLIFHSQETLRALASVLALTLVLMCLYFLLHVIAQAVRQASKDMEAEEEAATADVFRRQASTFSKSVNSSQKKQEVAAASGCTGRLKRWIVDHALPLVQESQDEKYWMEPPGRTCCGKHVILTQVRLKV